MENLNEYLLTADEREMVSPLIEQSNQVQNELQAILRAILRLRKLEGNWSLMDGKLVKAVVPNGNGTH
jgi:hypothetical protein